MDRRGDVKVEQINGSSSSGTKLVVSGFFRIREVFVMVPISAPQLSTLL